MSRIKACQ